MAQTPCLQNGGQWYEGEVCGDFTCPILTEACCNPDGRQCRDVTVDECFQLEGNPRGPGSRCLGDTNGNELDDACEMELPCDDCGPGDHWIDECRGGDDHMPSGALIGIDWDDNCIADVSLGLRGPVHVRRSDPLDDSLVFPESAPVDQHLEVIDTEIMSLVLVGGGVAMIAGGESGQVRLERSLGVIVEQRENSAHADSFFDVFFEVDLGGGLFAYNQEALRVFAKIDCVPPDTAYINPMECIRLYTSPVPRQGEFVANLVSGIHSTYPDCGDPVTGTCFEPNGTPFCDDGPCCDVVCEHAPQCCELEWGGECAEIAREICLAPQACCLPDGRCDDAPADKCRQHDGVPGGPGSRCRGDCNQNGVDDACEVLGDLDGDGDVDHVDWRLSVGCFGGPAVDVEPDCLSADLNCDGEVDMEDVRLFQQVFGG